MKLCLSVLLLLTTSHFAWADAVEEEDKKAIASELLISNTETKAIESLQAILKKKKGSPDEPDLWYRLAELYMRKSRSGRFFELQKSVNSKQLSLFPVPSEEGSEWLKKASNIYSQIENNFKNYKNMDSVLFNNAFANQQMGKTKEALILYEKMVDRFPNATLVPDALVALGELSYDQKRFAMAAEYLGRLEKFPDSRVFPYGMYKLAWTHYNMSDTRKGVKRLLQVVELSPPVTDEFEANRNRQNLRREALRDLTIFIGDTHQPEELVSTFAKITQSDELGQAMTDLARLYESHSRFKEMIIFINEFLEKYPDNVYSVKARLSLVSANESLKRRDEVVKHLEIARQQCLTDSAWRLKQKKEIPDESCSKDFMTEAKDIAEKWWEIWLKNKKHQEFTLLTEKALRIIISIEDRENPDLKTHYAYAELLFALERFDESSDQYRLVGEKLTSDPKIQHDATYAALFAKDKSIQKLDKQKSPLKEGERKDLALNYVKKYPKGAQAPDVNFKLAVIYYDELNFNESQKWLKPCIEGQFGRDLQSKAEDLQLDIYNLKKDYKSIQDLAGKISSSTKDSARQTQMTKILQEATYAEIQEDIKSGKKVDGATKLISYHDTFTKSKLAPAALWQAVGLYFTEGASMSAADTAVIFAKKYPQDERSLDGLKEAAKTYAETGYLLKAAETLKLVIALEKDKSLKRTQQELAADFFALEQKGKEARSIYEDLAKDGSAQTKSRLYSKILSTYSDRTGAEYAKIQNNILSMNIEPFASQMLFEKLKALNKAGKKGEAFELARKLTARETTPEIRARARLVQAHILEEELVRQSIKSQKAERFGLVLSMKTEKLEKAQTAYLGASKMSPDPQVQIESLSGIDRCYSNYVESLKNTEFPSDVSPEDLQSLKNEIAKIVTQVSSRRTENNDSLKKLAKVKMYESHKTWNLEETNTDQSLRPLVHYPPLAALQVYLPANNELIFSKMKRVEGRMKSSCTLKSAESNLFDTMATCFSTKDFREMEKISFKLVESREQKTLGIYYLSLVAELQGAFEKSLYFSDLALKSRNDAPLFHYQKARMLYQIEGLNASLPSFEKVLDMQMSSTETETLRGIKAYNEDDFETVITKFSKLTTDQLYNLEIGTLLSESYAKAGQIDKALKVIEELVLKGTQNLELVLQKARILETYKNAPLMALEAYEKALGLTNDEELKNWLDRKLDLLKNNSKGRAARDNGRPQI